MNKAAEANAWDPFGEAILAYSKGDRTAHLRQHYADGEFTDLPVEIFFRPLTELPDLEAYALSLCKGKILDVGAGAGCHSSILQGQKMEVTALDISPVAVKVMLHRGIEKVICADIQNFRRDSFDTLLILMNGIGFVGDLSGLDQFLVHARSLLNPSGQILLDSSDLRMAGVPELHGEQYFGETTLKLEFNGKSSKLIHWLYIDHESLKRVANSRNWNFELLFQGEEGHYLARLTQPLE